MRPRPTSSAYISYSEYLAAYQVWLEEYAQVTRRQDGIVTSTIIAAQTEGFTTNHATTGTSRYEVQNFEEFYQVFKKPKLNKMDLTILKERHLQRDERQMLHQPKSDWCESGKGDVCKSACTLEIGDLVAKIK